MSKVVIDKDTFKVLASETRLKILKALDGRKMNLSEIARATGLSKTTVLEHMNKLVEADLVKKMEREGHKWTYYKLSWKGSSLLHPDNTKIVITFCISMFLLFFGISQILVYGNGFHIEIEGEISTPRYVQGGAAGALPEKSSNQTESGDEIEILPKDYLRSYIRNQTLLKTNPQNVYIESFNITVVNNSMAEYGTISNETHGNGTNITFMEGGAIKMNAEVFYQDPFYLYIGLLLVSVSAVLMIFSFGKLWRRKDIFDVLYREQYRE